MSADIRGGLTETQVKANRLTYGRNVVHHENPHVFLKTLKEVVIQPMFILLTCASLLYFIMGQQQEGLIMLVAIVFVSGISIYQENKSRKAIQALEMLSTPQAKVIRDGVTRILPSDEIVVNDLIVVEDGNLVPADAEVIELHDFSVNESILTGESLSVTKNSSAPNNLIFQGTMIVTGSCIARVTAIGSQTVLGKIGQSLEEMVVTKTPLQLQIKNFVSKMAWTGVGAFIIVWGINYYLSKSFLHGLMQGLTMAMSVLPEEIPVAFSTFMALGAYELYKRKVITRNPHTVEALGAATVICTDKTGTITENRMSLSAIYDFTTDRTFDFTIEPLQSNVVLEYAMWSSETEPFDNMEKSIHESYASTVKMDQRPYYSLVHEYPLSGNPPIMTHVFSHNNSEFIIAVKGSVEGVLKQSKLTIHQKEGILAKTKVFASKGYRVLAVGTSGLDFKLIPGSQHEFKFDFLGLVAFYDPPKSNISQVLKQFYDAGLKVKIITGDYAETVVALAHQIRFRNDSNVLTGSEVLAMDKQELSKKVNTVNIFARMFPEAKLKVIEALKANGEVVAMTGDGVNDGPALKAAHIGVAMGLRGSEIAKQAASLVLMDDDLAHMVEAVAIGRRIYENLKKAIQYIISIHIPIILIITIPLLLSWKFREIFLPIHVIFLELIMGPTCSIVFAREPIEPDSMLQPPRKMSTSFFSFSELTLSILQGLVITLACLGLGYYFMSTLHSEAEVRTVIYTTLIFSNIFLTLENRSFQKSIFTTIKYKNNLLPIIILVTLVVFYLFIYVPQVRDLFQFAKLSAKNLLLCISVAAVGVLWIEIYEFAMRKRRNSLTSST